MATTTGQCRKCLHWKRKTNDAGVCWNKAVNWFGSMVAEFDGCDKFEAKVIRVEQTGAKQ